ncbi:MAG TPA: hypothetical protein VM095_18175 [Pyrinomonadaceae bacterium]|nr:hypothetical protein [Pyrinomonadaceae bacterium]
MMRILKRLTAGSVLMLATLSISGSASAQDAPPPTDKKPGDVLIFERQVAGPGVRVPGSPGQRMGDDTISFMAIEMSLNGKVVKGAPYSAQAVTESTRTLADGNKIKHQNTASVYRDGEGRTRRDQELGAVGPWAMPGEPQQTVFINDSVSGVNYVLDPRTRIARKMAPFRVTTSSGGAGNVVYGSADKINIEREVRTTIVQQQAAAAPTPHAGGPPLEMFRISADPRNSKTESLGKQVVEGVEAEGTRTTITIPAGEIGNEQAINIVSERWYSPELQVIVMSKNNDPLVGETVYRLTNITRSEPARALFEVPADYTIKEMPGPTRIIRKKSGDEK